MSRAPVPESIVSQLWRHRWWIVPGFVFAVIAVIIATYKVSLAPPSLQRDSAEYAAASTQVLIDFPQRSAMVDIHQQLPPLVERANVYARLGPSPAILDIIGKKAGVDPSLIDASGPYNPGGERLLREPSPERRSTQLRAERDSYRLRFDSETDQQVPIVNIYAQAPTLVEAQRLADSAAQGLRQYVVDLQRKEKVEDWAGVKLTQLGPAHGGVVNPGVDRQIAMLMFVSTLAGWALLVLLTSNFMRYFRDRAGRREPEVAEPGQWELFLEPGERQFEPPGVR